MYIRDIIIRNLSETLLLYYIYSDVFSDNRIVIAVNKYDHYLEDMSGMSQPWQEKQQPDLKQKVCDQIKARIGHKCPPEFVVPVSGKWAVYAQNLKHYPNNEKWKKKVIECLSMVPEQLREESDPENQAKLLESSSGISELGDRYGVGTNSFGIKPF